MTVWDEHLKEQFQKEHTQPCPTSGLEEGQPYTPEGN
jgi:hypothetical protein